MKFKTDSVPETNTVLPRSGFIHGTRTACAKNISAPSINVLSASDLQTDWEFNNSLIHPLQKPMADFKSAPRGSPPGPASLEVFLPSLGGFVM